VLGESEIIAITDQILTPSSRSRAGIVHQDIKPDNIMLQELAGHPNFVRVLDFGMAKFVQERSDTNFAMGTPTYMAPEQLLRKNIGPWTDLYALRALLLKMVRRAAFSADRTALISRLDPGTILSAALAVMTSRANRPSCAVPSHTIEQRLSSVGAPTRVPRGGRPAPAVGGETRADARPRAPSTGARLVGRSRATSRSTRASPSRSADSARAGQPPPSRTPSSGAKPDRPRWPLLDAVDSTRRGRVAHPTETPSPPLAPFVERSLTPITTARHGRSLPKGLIDTVDAERTTPSPEPCSLSPSPAWRRLGRPPEFLALWAKAG
jgi:serine/threonine protein kinase